MPRFAVALSVLLLLSVNLARAAESARIERVPAPAEGSVCATIPWVRAGETGWKRGEPTFRLTGKNVRAEGWIAATDGELLLHVVVEDAVHVGQHGGSQMWKNDCLRIGFDARGDGSMGRPTDRQVVGIGDASVTFALTDDGPAAWVEVHGAVAGRGIRPELAPDVTRDDAGGRAVYDLRVPWEEFAQSGPAFPVVGLAVYVVQSDAGAPEAEVLRWDAAPQESWEDRAICGVFKPGLFRRLAVGQPEHKVALISVTNRMLSEHNPAAEAMVAVSGDAADAVVVGLGERRERLDLPPGNGLQRLRLCLTPEEPLAGSAPFRVELLDGERTVARTDRVVRGDYLGDWYAFQPANDTGPSVIGMEDWLDAPAGRHGGVRMVDDHFEFADGTPVKFWGLNIGGGTFLPGWKRPRSREDLAEYARHYRKYGVNCLRVHKHMENVWGGILSEETVTKFDPKELEQYDYFMAELKKNGVYHALSPWFHLKLQEGDRDRVIAFDEIMEQGSTYGFSSFAPDVQDVHIETLVNLLNHRNPYTGLRYAEDPAVAYIELRNEDSIFFYATQSRLLSAPTYKRLFCERFSDWLKQRYGSHEALVEAWGADALNAWDFCYPAEHLDRRNVFPICNAWWFSPEGLASQEAEHGAKRRILDTAEFLYEVQSGFYHRFVEAIRETGYEGPIVGSCWWAGSGVPHYLNLYTDYEVGFIDRHEYYGGGGFGGRSSFSGASPLAEPGSGSLAEGFNQVVDRPFGLSEWIGVFPYPWAADGPPMIAAYGMGLQGWDSSFEFASGKGRFTETASGRWNTQRPTQIGQYPTLARMVYRGDVEEGSVVSNRKVHVPSLLAEGRLGFVEEIGMGQTADFNAIRGDVPAAALAAGRVVVEFTNRFERTDEFDLSGYREGAVVRSETGQLAWTGVQALHPRPASRTWMDQQGYFTIDTAGTKGVVGFAPKQGYRLGAVTIEPDNLFAVVIVTAASPNGTVADDSRLLVSAVARSRNTGMEYQPAMTMSITEKGEAPILMEPVRAEITVARPGEPTVHVLDHDGRRTGRTLPVEDGTFRIDGARDRALYYEIVYE